MLEMVRGFEKASGVKIKYVVGPRRAGDLATVVADPRKANAELKWTTSRTLETIMASAWKWQSQNPEGYVGKGKIRQGCVGGGGCVGGR